MSFESIEVYLKPLPETSGLQAMPKPAATAQKNFLDFLNPFSRLSPRTEGPTNSAGPSTATTDSATTDDEKMPGGFEDNRELCSYGTICSKYDNPDHFQKFAHPFVTPCRDLLTCNLQFNSQNLSHINVSSTDFFLSG